MKKIISFSLWGKSSIYIVGAIENIKLSKRYYKGWDTRFYVAEDCPALKTIQGLSEVIVTPPMDTLDKTKDGWENNPNHTGMMYRFLPLADPTVERMVSKDADSRLSPSCYDAFCRWEESGMLATVLYGCEAHTIAPQGGLFGSVCNLHGNDRYLKHLMLDFIHNYEEHYPRQRWVFLDILFVRDVIIGPIAFSTLFQGYGTDNPFRVEQPPECGRFIGDIVGESMRGQIWTAPDNN